MGLYTVDCDGYTEVYTDGACINNGKRNAKAGIGIWFGQNNWHNVSRPVNGRATNNTAEIQAVTVAAEQALKARRYKLKIITDSQFLINSFNKWLPKWKNNGWRTCQGHKVINKDDFIEMENALDRLHDYKFKHVNSHQGLYGNEMADQLARKGAERYKRYDDSSDSDDY